MHGAYVADRAGAEQDESQHIEIGLSLCHASPDHQVGEGLPIPDEAVISPAPPCPAAA